MTPRVVVTSVDEKITLQEFQNDKKFLNFSRIPTYSTQNEKITGYVFLQDILEKLSEKENNNLLIRDFKRDILTIPYGTTLLNLWNQILDKKEYIDNYLPNNNVIVLGDLNDNIHE